MKTRQQAAEEFFPFQNPDQEIQCISINDLAMECHKSFLAGCEHDDKESRDFYLLVKEYRQAEEGWYKYQRKDYFDRMNSARDEIDKHLAAFTEREQQSLPFKD